MRATSFKYLLRYEIGEELRFISHLDFLRTFTRALRRSQTPICFSNGFNPHVKISFALPLSTGTTSECEMLSAEFEEVLGTDDVLSLIKSMPKGLRLVDCTLIQGKPWGKIVAAEYFISMEHLPSQDELDTFLKSEKILPKSSKSGTKLVDIAPMIHSAILCDEGILVTLTAGEQTLKPSLFMQALQTFIHDYQHGWYLVHRKRILF